MRFNSLAGVFVLLLSAGQAVRAAEFRSQLPDVERIWIGPDYWANRLHDWRIAAGRIECVSGGENRNLHLLTCQLTKQPGAFEMSVRTGPLSQEPSARGWVGFLAAARGRFDDYRESAVYGTGIHAGITMDGRVFIEEARGKTNAQQPRTSAEADPALAGRELTLHLVCTPAEGQSELVLTAVDPAGGAELARVVHRVSPSDLHGNVALVCHSEPDAPRRVRYWFADWRLAGEKVAVHPEQAFGPVLFVQHTLSRGVLKMTAQMPPVGKQDAQTVGLILGDKKLEAPIDALSRTTTWRVPLEAPDRDLPYRVVYRLNEQGGAREHVFTGTVRRDPVDKPQIVVAGFTGNYDAGFPNNDVVAHVRAHAPDLLVFTGDQIYEHVGGYGVQRSPLDQACLDYLRKWFILGWSYRTLMADTPSVCLPDDHDVFHGNLWGCGGRRANGVGKPGQDSGGYTMPPEFVRMVERTQTSHLPDPYDPTPVEQGIGVYYCAMNYGGISFAIIEDRKFKSAPAELLPEARVDNGWAQNPDFDAPRQADVPGAQLLGERQMKFLREWGADWSGGAWMKVVLSQTIFADVVTLPPPASTDSAIPKLPIPKPGEYPEGEIPVADMDSNSWPQTPRNEAVRELRRCFAFHIAGDQHLGSTIQYGVDAFGDAGFALCVPSVANVWPRRWFPARTGGNHKAGTPRYTGDYLDGFGNRMSVRAVCNPVVTGHDPADLHDRATGYGIARFDRASRKITIENWPRYADPKDPATGGPYPGWPITVDQLENYGRKPAGYLPTLKIEGTSDPVVQVVDEADGDIVYTLRIAGTSFRPMVFRDGRYTVRVSDPDRRRSVEREGVQSLASDSAPGDTLTIDLR